MRRPKPIRITAQELSEITGLQFEQSNVTAWQQTLEVLASDCLATIKDRQKRKMALKNLLAHFLLTQGSGQVASESLGDASIAYKDTGKGSDATRYGTLAKQIAPCLGVTMGDTHPAGVMLIR